VRLFATLPAIEDPQAKRHWASRARSPPGPHRHPDALRVFRMALLAHRV
jgi:hypothetical protein